MSKKYYYNFLTKYTLDQQIVLIKITLFCFTHKYHTFNFEMVTKCFYLIFGTINLLSTLKIILFITLHTNLKKKEEYF